MDNKWIIYLVTFPQYELKGDATKKLRKFGMTSNIKQRIGSRHIPGSRIYEHASSPITKDHAWCVEQVLMVELPRMDNIVSIESGGIRDRLLEYFLCDDNMLVEIIAIIDTATKMTDRNHAEDKTNILREKKQYSAALNRTKKYLDALGCSRRVVQTEIVINPGIKIDQ